MKPLDTQRWVPQADPEWQQQLERLAEALSGRRVCILTGAGCSTESGIPDYRGEGTAQRARNPIQFKKFIDDEAGRRRYWARAMIGWPRFRTAQPNRAHRACADLEKAGIATGVITQNVDRLHRKAGSRNVVELHGALEDVVCLDCEALEHRDELQARLELNNPGFVDQAHELAPDGDADIIEDLSRDFRVADCRKCGGMLKPRVVFFGEGVPAETVDAAWRVYNEADALLVAGSSLAVFSGYRFARKAAKDGKPIFVINIGATRADDLARLFVRGNAGASLEALSFALLNPP